MVVVILFSKQKTAYEMRISDWSSDVCSSDPLGNLVERLLPADLLVGVAAGAALADAPQRRGQAVGMMNPLGVARDLGADNAVGIVVAARAAHLADARARQPLDLERAGARAEIGRASCRERVCQSV